jgi:hypothetical protein
MKNRFITILITAVMTLGGSALLTGATLAQAPPTQLATNSGGSSLCMNSQGGGTAQGTHVIGYNCGDPNNDYGWQQMDTACGGGVVTATCPFANTSIDASLKGYVIVRAYNDITGLCVGNPNSSGGGSVLTGCGDNGGNGEGWAVMDVLEGVTEILDYDGHAVNVVNRHWTDSYNSEKYVCGTSYKDQFTLAGSTPTSGLCQIRQID